MEIQVCKTSMDFPTELGMLRDANALLGQPQELRDRMAEDGYLLFRGFHSRRLVAAARERILEEMKRNQFESGQHRSMKEIACEPEVMAVLESPALFDFFAGYFGEGALTFDEKWLRAVPHGAYTGLHYDIVYMGRGSQRLHTVWTPFGDLPMQLGTLAICVGSHMPQFARLQETYGRHDVDRDKLKDGGWYSHDPREVTTKFGGTWKSCDFQMGDIVVFPMYTMHCSTRNMTDEIRLSCDIRFQPASDPADQRWAGPNRTGHSGGPPLGDAKTMDDAKKEWGV